MTRSSLIIFDDWYSGFSVHFSVSSSVLVNLTFIRFRFPLQVFPKDELTINFKKNLPQIYFLLAFAFPYSVSRMGRATFAVWKKALYGAWLSPSSTRPSSTLSLRVW